jgi:fucose 4-O-acetylase-like acetyltransferase
MPLFCIVSGFLMQKSLGKEVQIREFWMTVLRRLGIPFAAALAIWYLIRVYEGLWTFSPELLLVPWVHLWFVWAYLLSLVMLYAGNSRKSLYWMLGGTGTYSFIAFTVLNGDYVQPILYNGCLGYLPGLRRFTDLMIRIPSYLFFFILGAWFWEKRNDLQSARIFIVAGLFLLSVRVYLWNQTDLANDAILPGALFVVGNALVGCLVPWFASKGENGPGFPFITWLGLNTLFLYLYHPLVLAVFERILGRGSLIGWLVSALTLIGMAILQTVLVRWRFARTLFLGVRSI